MGGRRIEQEAQAHMALGKLLRKERPPELQEAVQKVLDSRLSTDAKIARIRKIDGEAAPLDEAVTGAREEGDASKSETQLWQPLRFTLGRLKAIIKLPHAPTPFLRYLFLEHSKIKDFGKKTHVFAPTVLLPIVRLDKTVPAFFSGSLQAWSERLIDLLAPALENGWQVLSKRDYNMVAAIKKLCDEISAVNFKILNFRDRYFIDRIRNIEAMFFVFHCHHDYVERAVESVTHALLADGEHDEAAEEAEILVKSILTRGYSIPSLFDLLLGLNMMKFHREFSYTDLIASDLGELFNQAHFACGPKVQQSIDGSVEKLRESIMKLSEHQRQLQRVREYLPVRDDGEFDEGLLESFYEFGESKFSGAYRRDRDNVVLFVPQFLRKLDIAYGPLLVGKTRLSKSGLVAVFNPQLFLQPIDQIRRLGFKLEQASFGYRIFTYGRYIGIRRDGKGAITAEADIVRFLQEAITDCEELANRVAGMLSRTEGEPTAAGSARSDEERGAGGLRPVLPHDGEKVLSPGFLEGRTVRGALEVLVSLCFLVAKYLYDKELADLKGSEESVRTNVSSQLHTFERLADEAAFREVMARVLVPGNRYGGGTVPTSVGDSASGGTVGSTTSPDAADREAPHPQ